MVYGTPSQSDAWSVYYKGNNIYRIYGNLGKWVLDKKSNAYNIFANEIDSDSLDGESWILDSWPDGSYALKAAHGNGAFLDVKDNQTPFMNTVTTRTDLMGQHWYFQTTTAVQVTNTVVSRTTAPPTTVVSTAPGTTAVSTAPPTIVVSTAPGTTAVSTAPGTTLIVVPGPTEISTVAPTVVPSSAASAIQAVNSSPSTSPSAPVTATQVVTSILNSNALPSASSTSNAASDGTRNRRVGAASVGVVGFGILVAVWGF